MASWDTNTWEVGTSGWEDNVWEDFSSASQVPYTAQLTPAAFNIYPENLKRFGGLKEMISRLFRRRF